MHPLLSVFISCIYFELIFKMKSVDNTSANPRISIAGNAVLKDRRHDRCRYRLHA